MLYLSLNQSVFEVICLLHLALAAVLTFLHLDASVIDYFCKAAMH